MPIGIPESYSPEGTLKKKNKAKPVSVDLNIKSETENEVSIGGESFTVRVRSHAPLGDCVRQAETLFRLGPSQGPKLEAGFSLPSAERRGTDDQRGSSAPWPPQPIQ